MLHLINVSIETFNNAVGFERIKFGDALDAYLCQTRDVFIGDFTQ